MMKRRTLLGTTLSALALSLMALSSTAYSADTATTAVAASSALFNYTEEGHEALPLATMDAATAQQLAASFKYSQEPKVVAQDVAYALMQQKGAVVVDVREPHEYAAGHIPGAYNIPKDTVLSNADLTALKDQQIPIMVYCRSGGRAGDVLQALSKHYSLRGVAATKRPHHGLKPDAVSERAFSRHMLLCQAFAWAVTTQSGS